MVRGFLLGGAEHHNRRKFKVVLILNVRQGLGDVVAFINLEKVL